MSNSTKQKPRKSLLAKVAVELTEKEIETVTGAGGCHLPSHSFTPDPDYCPNDN
jgi:hypothetical protein